MKSIKLLIFILSLYFLSCKNYQDEIPKYPMVVVKEEKFNPNGTLDSYLIYERNSNTGLMIRGNYYNSSRVLTSYFIPFYKIINNIMVIDRFKYYNTSNIMTDEIIYLYDTNVNNIERLYYSDGTQTSCDIRTFEYFRTPVKVTNYNPSKTIINYIEYNTLSILGQIEMVIKQDNSSNIISSQIINYNSNRLRTRVNNYNSSGNLTYYIIYHYR